MAIDHDGMPGMRAIAPLAPTVVPGARRVLRATLSRIDGWGQRAWREIMGPWRLSAGVLVLSALEGGVDGVEDPHLVNAILVLPEHGLGGDATDATATCDWVLREAWRRLVPRALVPCTTYRPQSVVRAHNACWLQQGQLHLRLLVRLPFAGMCCDGRRFGRFLRQLERFAATLVLRRARPSLARLRRCVRIQGRLRSALGSHGLVAFLGDGSRLARSHGSDGGRGVDSDRAASACRALRAPARLRVTIDLGPDGRFHGLGIPRGVTAIVGAPYHGKSTLLSALAAGRDDHVPGDGRELVVAVADAVVVQSEEGRRIKHQDVSGFFARLPGSSSTDFSTERASGATSMAASLLQGCAGGATLLLIDEDTAAANFLAIDPTMRRLLQGQLSGTVGLLESLRGLAEHGLSTVLVAGASSAALEAAERVVLMQHFTPSDASARVRRLLRSRPAQARVPRGGQAHARMLTRTQRRFHDDPDCLLGPRHFLQVDATEPERPRLVGPGPGAALPVDLRRCGWTLDRELARGACVAAAWCCRLAERGMSLRELKLRYEAFLAARGATGLDPFHTQILAVPPWQLVVTVLERLPTPRLMSRGGGRH